MYTMKLRTKYELKAPKGAEIQYREHEAALLAAGKKAIPDKAVTVCEDHLLVDELTNGEVRALGRAIAQIPGLNSLGLKNVATVFCDLTGEPVCGKEHFRKLAAEDNRLAREAFETEDGSDADDDIEG